MKALYLLSLSFLTFISLHAQMVKKSEAGPFLLKNATIHTITKGVIQGDLLISGERIEAIGQNIKSSAKYTVLDCTGKHIYPGMIDGGTQVALSEIEAVSITNDFNEIGDFIPHMQALTAVNPNAVTIPVTRTNGVTTVLTGPKGGRFPGTAALIDLHGYTPEQMYAGFKGVVLNFPSSGRRGRFDRRSDEDVKKDAEKALKKLDDIWAEAVLYAQIDSAAAVDKNIKINRKPEMDALLPVIRKQGVLLVEVNKSEDIKAALGWIAKNKINAVLTGVAEGSRVAQDIAKAGLAVITGPVLETPRRDYDRYDTPYANAGNMLKAGVRVAIRTDEAENARNLPFHAGFAAAYGMGIDEAYRAVSIVPAEIFGVSKFYGSLEAGKVANLYICDGDPFETRNQVEALFIRGWKVPLESRHTLLYDEFIQRSPGVK
ncbi:MAG: amidohydrolase family protein [Saprospiraceae bacterium]|nr:amidohydrolase family protein [Saprospiraceae bacterium]